MYGFLAATGEFYKEDTFFSAAIIAPTYSFAVGGILVTLFVCSYLRYRAGFGFAIFFTYAVIPYLVFRLSFLFGIIGISSPFQMLPDYGIGYFLKNPWTNQAFGVCTHLGEKFKISTSSIRLYFIYTSFLTMGSPVIIYLILAF